jgi:hypothetical protein
VYVSLNEEKGGYLVVYENGQEGSGGGVLLGSWGAAWVAKYRP